MSCSFLFQFAVLRTWSALLTGGSLDVLLSKTRLRGSLVWQLVLASELIRVFLTLSPITCSLVSQVCSGRSLWRRRVQSLPDLDEISLHDLYLFLGKIPHDCREVSRLLLPWQGCNTDLMFVAKADT